MSDDAKKNATSTNHIEPSTLITPKPPRKRRWTKGEKRFAKVARVVQSPSLSAPKTAELTCTANTTPTATKVSTTEVSISTLSATASVSVSAATVSVQQPSQHSTSSALITQTSHLDTTAKLTQPQPQPNENENVSNVSSKKKRKKKKKKIVLPIPSIDQLIQCAKNAQYTKSVYICDGTPTPPTTNEEFIRHQEGRRRNQKFNLMACTSSGVEDVIVSTSSCPQNELSSWVLLNATRTTTTKHHSGGGGGGGGGENQTHTTTTADQSTSSFGLVTTHDGGGVRKQGGGNTNTDEMRHSTTKTQQHARPQSQQLLLRQPLNPQKRIIHIHLQPLLILDLNGILCHRIRQEPNTTCVATTTTTHQQQQQQQQNTTFNSSNNHNTQRYRPSCGRIAYTDVVARPNVKSWLCYLDHYFTLAVWTSATKKTAKALVKMIFPPNVESKLLFIWAQNRCNCILAPSNTTTGNENTNSSSSYNNTANQKQPHGGDEQQSTEEPLAVAKDPNQLNTTFNSNTVKKKKLDHSETLFVKCLSKVWKEFPLWDQTNTILIDDTPEKCRSFESNTLHPPPMNGLLPNRNELECLDEKNEQEQSIFFQALVNYYWKQQQHNQQHEGQQPRELTMMLPHDDQEIHQQLESKSIANGCPTNADNNYNSLVQFLHKHGSGHMGWRG